MVIAKPFCCQYKVGVLLVLERMVHSQMSKLWVAASWWRRLPANSRLEFVMDPHGLEVLTRCWVRAAGKEVREVVGVGMGLLPWSGLLG